MSIFPTQPKFKVIEKLGQGTFGIAYKVLNTENNNYYVIKKRLLKLATDDKIKEIKNEANILSKLSSENIVKYYDSFLDNDSFNIIMEYCDGLDLRKFINEHKRKNVLIERNIILHIISGICKGLKVIHNSKLIHRDLKPDNIFLTADLTVKIGDFGLSKELNNSKDYAVSEVGTLFYMAPEILNGKKYNNKVDMWALGCIIYELCTLNYCFQSNSIKELIDKINSGHHGKIDRNLYGEDLLKLIDSLLNVNYHLRPDVDRTINLINNNLNEENIMEKFLEDDTYENYIIEKNVLNSINQIEEVILARENKFNNIKFIVGGFILGTGLNTIAAFMTGGISAIAFFALCVVLDLGAHYAVKKYLDPEEKERFLMNNSAIILTIQNTLMIKIKYKLDESPLKQNKNIIIYNKENFDNKISKIKNKILKNNYIKKLKKLVTKNFNILLLGCANAGKSTLINEFLKLPDNEKAKESTGGPTDTIDFKPYSKNIKDKTYTLYDTNGITNKGEDSIESKKAYIKNEIDKRLKDKDPNKLIHCIWYCFQGSNVQPSDKEFIESLLNIYTTYTIPIIFIHTQTYSKSQSNTCKLGIEKYLNEIYNNDKAKIDQQLKNYINILARGEEEIKAFGLDELEKITQKEIEEKGIKSSYFEYIKRDIMPLLINGVFNLIFTEYNIKKLKDNSMESIEKFLEKMIAIVNSDKLGLTQDIKNENKTSLKKMCDCFKNIKNELKDDLVDLLEIKKLKKDYRNYIKIIYDKKSSSYKKDMTYENFCENVEHLIYDNFAHNKDEIINNLINLGFILYIFDFIKSGINEQFKDIEEKILNEIYTKIFKELNN